MHQMNPQANRAFLDAAHEHLLAISERLDALSNYWHDAEVDSFLINADDGTWPFALDLDEQCSAVNLAVERIASLRSRSEMFTSFAAQNTEVMKGMPFDLIEEVEQYASAHSGNLLVLVKQTGPSTYAKVHDDWGDSGKVVLHHYDPDDADGVDSTTEWCGEFSSGRDAVLAFLALPEYSGGSQ